jgi:hypothetical protein
MKLVITINMAKMRYCNNEYEYGCELASMLELVGKELIENGPIDTSGYRIYEAGGDFVGSVVVEP